MSDAVVREVTDRVWDEVQAGSDPDPYCTRAFQRAESDALGRRPVLLDLRSASWSAWYVVVLTPLPGGGVLARTPEYGGLWVTRVEGPVGEAILDVRDEVDRCLRDLGAVSEVALLSPFLPHRAEVVRASAATPDKAICVADLGSTADVRSLSKGRRADLARAGREQAASWEPLRSAAARRFADHYGAAMEEKEASPRWRLGPTYFEALADVAGERLRIATVEGPEGGASGLFLVAEQRAAYVYATRWGRAGGAASAVLWQARQALREEGVVELLLGGGVTDAPDDSLLRFKRSLSEREERLHLAARAFDPAAHDRAVAEGAARPLPAGAVTV